MRCAVALVRALIATKEIVRRASKMPRKKVSILDRASGESFETK